MLDPYPTPQAIIPQTVPVQVRNVGFIIYHFSFVTLQWRNPNWSIKNEKWKIPLWIDMILLYRSEMLLTNH